MKLLHAFPRRGAASNLKAMALGAALALCAPSLGACDSAKDDDAGAVEVAGFALTGDDESDDGFSEGASLDPLLAEAGAEATAEDGEVPPATEVDTEALPEGADKIARTVLIVWGQPTLEAAMEGTPTTWKGRVTTDVGAMKVLRGVRFERGAPQLDHLVRDQDPKSVSFETVTTTHHDGVLVRLVLPRDASAISGNFTFETEHFTKSVPLAAIVAGRHLVFDADDLGNEVMIASHLPHRCPNGLVRLRWDRRNAAGGVVGGKIYADDGTVAGYVIGLWGKVDGKRRVKGAVLGPNREFRGTFRGNWHPFPVASGEEGGTFKGVWKGPANAVRGVLGGVYHVGNEAGEGSAQGFWRVRCDGAAGDCAADLGYAEPPTASCECGSDTDNGMSDACSCEVPPPQTCVAAEEPAAE